MNVDRKRERKSEKKREMGRVYASATSTASALYKEREFPFLF